MTRGSRGKAGSVRRYIADLLDEAFSGAEMGHPTVLLHPARNGTSSLTHLVNQDNLEVL